MRRVTRSVFLKVKCRDCSSEHPVFNRSASVVLCPVCGSVLAEPTGGLSRIRGEILGELP